MARPIAVKLRCLLALIKKEGLQIIRDPSSILISVLLPLILMFLYGFGVSLDLNHLRLGLVLEDNSSEALGFGASLVHSRYFEVVTAKDRRELEPLIVEGYLRGMVVVPSYFSSFMKRPDKIAPIQIIADGSEPNTARFVENYVTGAWKNWLSQHREGALPPKPSLITVRTRFWYNEQLESRNFLIPGSLAIIMTLIGTLLTSLVIAREWERGTMEALLSTSVGRGELLLGKLIPYFILGLLSMTVCVVIALFFYEIPFRGSFFALFFVTSVFLFCALGVGLLVSTLSHSQQVASQVSIVLGFLPAFMLSGFLFEISSMPKPIQLLTYLFPARYFVSCLQTLFMVGDIWPLLVKNILPMACFGSLLFLLTLHFTPKRLD